MTHTMTLRQMVDFTKQLATCGQCKFWKVIDFDNNNTWGNCSSCEVQLQTLGYITPRSHKFGCIHWEEKE
jgi:hypothetical protein